MKTINRCACGKRISKYARDCKGCSMEKSEKYFAEARVLVQAMKCPACGAGLRRNNSLAGWYQCEQFGAEGFRKDPSKPSCNWQIFTQ